MENKYKITAFYKFIKLSESEVPSVRTRILEAGASTNLKGLIIASTEGVNGTVSTTPDQLEQFKVRLKSVLSTDEILFKDSWANKNPFRRFKVKLRPEIVTIGDTAIYPEASKNNHLSPTEWNKVLEEEEVVLIDTRNKYETEVGMFKNAIDPRIDTFGEFPEYVRTSGIPKDKKVLMYCTGGIRCEKAILEMQRQGYNNVYQLEGGILKYFEQYPNKHFDGECFVFDHRVSVNQELEPSKKFHLCAHCGNPGDLIVECKNCSKPAKICKKCGEEENLLSCSKNCAYHLGYDGKGERRTKSPTSASL